jgi:ribonuclease P protein component
MGTSHTFHKLEKLSHKASIDSIFQKKGKSIYKSPILFAYYKTDLETPFPCQLMVSVGKRKFKKAVDRNRIKRQITDVYRRHKYRMYEAVGPENKYAIGILFLGKRHPEQADLEKKLILCIDEFIKLLSQR